MQKVKLVFIFIFLTSVSFSQFKEKCSEIALIDNKIYTIDVPNSVDNKVIKENINLVYTNNEQKKGIYDIIETELVPLLEIGTESFSLQTYANSIDCIEHVETMTWLEYYISEKFIKFYDISKISNKNQTLNIYKKVLTITRDKIDELMATNFTHYKFTNGSKQWVKGIYIEHGNDVFAFTPKYQDDRDMTGAFRFEFFTDQAKMRLMSSFSNRMLNINGRGWYSYQSIFMGGEGYTPYLRDTTIFNQANSFDPDDRPYASFVYFGRSKHRITRLGRYRTHSQIKIGTIGSDKGSKIQSTIHKDITIWSHTPKGWDSQIAAGGRLALNYQTLGEMIINKEPILGVLHFSGLGEFSVGHDQTSGRLGFSISNKDLKERGGINVDLTKNYRADKFRNRIQNGLTVNLTASYKRMFHNSMLEGYGVFTHAVDNDPSTPIDVHTLTDDQMVRDLFIVNFDVAVRLRYVSLFWKYTLMSPEFDLPVNSKIYPNGDINGQIYGNHNSSPWNHYATIGFLFTME